LERFAPGDHIALWAANCPDWVLIELGAAFAGIVLVPVNPDDEVLVRMPICQYLRDRGYRVLEAADADEAATILQMMSC
jgi:acyl-CoA synthetase (AMP-forming)/AMP-acid ligase II